MNYAHFENEQMRLCILQILNSDSDYAMNALVISRAIEVQGYQPSFDKLKTEFAWLQEQGLVEYLNADTNVSVLKLTQRGSDVAQGRASVPGIPRPRPMP